MEPSHTRVLVEAAYAAGAGDRHEAAMMVLRLLEPVTHHDAGCPHALGPDGLRAPRTRRGHLR